MRVKDSVTQEDAHTHIPTVSSHALCVIWAHITFKAHWHLILVEGPNWSRFTWLILYQWRLIPELTAEGKTHSGNPLNVQTRRSESTSGGGNERGTHRSLKDITGNSVPPQCFNVLQDTLSHTSLQEEIKNQYMLLPIGLSKEAGRERGERDYAGLRINQTTDLHLFL